MKHSIRLSLRSLRYLMSMMPVILMNRCTKNVRQIYKKCTPAWPNAYYLVPKMAWHGFCFLKWSGLKTGGKIKGVPPLIGRENHKGKQNHYSLDSREDYYNKE